MPAGRPTEYRPEYNELVYKLCLLGATDKEIADIIGVTEQTLNNWKERYPELFESIRNGKEIADAEIAKSLYHRAKGYEHPEDKIFYDKDKGPVIVPTIKHYPPEPLAVAYWLNNRRGRDWRQKQEVEVSGSMVMFAGDDNLED
jgi:DNA-binding XRE family transcriptional regulator